MESNVLTDVISHAEQNYRYYSLQKCAEKFGLNLKKMAFVHKILLENVLRCYEKDEKSKVKAINAFKAVHGHGVQEVPFQPSRILMQDFTGVPAVVDLAGLRDAVAKRGWDPAKINPTCPVDLVVDHSVQVDDVSNEALIINLEKEMKRNHERYAFLKWGQASFDNFRLVPPGRGICHQVNLEYLAPVVWEDEIDGEKWLYPDSLVGLDSHTTMINALGVVGWGVGGIEAENAMLGNAIDVIMPKVIGVKLVGQLARGINATDLVLTLTQVLREYGVVGKYIEFFGPGLELLDVPARATIANMSPEFGSTCALFPIDQATLAYLRLTGRSDDHVDKIAMYARAQGLWHEKSDLSQSYQEVITFDLSTVEMSVAGPKRPQDRLNLNAVGLETEKLLLANTVEGRVNQKFTIDGQSMEQGAVVIAAITSCTNTSNPSLMIAAGMLAKKAIEKGLKIRPWVKASFAPGSAVVVSYLEKLGLLEYLEQLGFNVVGFGCTTCIGNSGPLDENISDLIMKEGLMVSAVLSGNRNFEGRIHPQVSLNWLASPQLVIAFALAGTTRINLDRDGLGEDDMGLVVRLKDVLPSEAEISDARKAVERSMYEKQYKDIFKGDQKWQELSIKQSDLFHWDEKSTYIRRPTFIDKKVEHVKKITKARVLMLLGDSVTTDHISPAGVIRKDSPAGEYLLANGVGIGGFNSYGSRRGNHEVMIRGTFANPKIKNAMLPNITGGFSLHHPSEKMMFVYDCAMAYMKTKTPLLIFAGKDYGQGSSRDWAAKGTACLGVKAVIAESFERIHRSNLVGMGVLPLQFIDDGWQKLALTGEEVFDINGIDDIKDVHDHVRLEYEQKDGQRKVLKLIVRLDTKEEIELYKNGGVFPQVLEGYPKKEGV